jgi:predicted TPR repeat methyltransferase
LIKKNPGQYCEYDQWDPEMITNTTRRPDRPFDLITSVHGLHFVGDKLGLTARAASWLTDEGTFVASLDLSNDKLSEGRVVTADLRRAGLQ